MPVSGNTRSKTAMRKECGSVVSLPSYLIRLEDEDEEKIVKSILRTEQILLVEIGQFANELVARQQIIDKIKGLGDALREGCTAQGVADRLRELRASNNKSLLALHRIGEQINQSEQFTSLLE